MGTSTARAAPEGFRFRRLDKPEEFRQVDELALSAGASGPAGTMTVPWLRVLQDNGGLVLGAFADIYLAGATVSMIGWDGTTLYHYSHLTVVRPEYQNHGVGFRLKEFQRDEVLRLGLAEIRGAFDPLESRAAALLVRRLGVRPDLYLPHYFGRPAGASRTDTETDRVRYRWEVTSPAVEARLRRPSGPSEEDRQRWASSTAIVETETGETGLRVPTAVAEPSGPSAHLEIPFDLATLVEHDPSGARRWRHAVRDAFRAATDVGYAVDDFAVVSTEHERRSFYFWRPQPARTAPASAGPTV